MVMANRRSEYDVTNRVKTDSLSAVKAEVLAISRKQFPKYSFRKLESAFDYMDAMFDGEDPEYHGCDTGYHNLQHTMEVTLAMARICSGYLSQMTRLKHVPAIDAKTLEFGIVCALFHDSGYFRKRNDYRAGNGAVYTKVHVTRGAKLLQRKLLDFGMDEFDAVAAPVLHFTGYERSVDSIRLKSPEARLLGCLLGTADIMSQMADRCYLEKCAKHLYTEFVVGGVARKLDKQGNEVVIFESADDLLRKTPGFYKGAMKRLDVDLQGVHQFVAEFFGGKNLYLEAIARNMQYVDAARDGVTLRRTA
jgi:hypothetical protein